MLRTHSEDEHVWKCVRGTLPSFNPLIVDGTVDGGEMDILSLGVNWWLTLLAQFGVYYRYILLGRFGTQGDSSGLNARILLILY